MKETELQRNYLGNESIETIYFGGGTPSLLFPNELKLLLDKIHTTFPVSPEPEITLESNPDDITAEKLESWKKAGINRLSIGIQSFFDDDLKWMNRAHNASQANDNLELAMKFFDNITIDLIYGTPHLTGEKWKHNVDIAIALGIRHLSCYALTVEPKTPLRKMIDLGKMEDINPDLQSEQFLLLMEWMEYAGYEHYEISNFSMPGYRSRHNTSYWEGKKYLGLGPSAHSFNGLSRQWNVANNSIYINAISGNEVPYELEELTPKQRLNEYIMTSLRTNSGLDLQHTGDNAIQLKVKSEKYIQRGLMTSKNNSLVLTKEGKLMADGIAADLFF